MNHHDDHKKFYTLSQLLESISAVINRTYANSYWIKAEMIKLNYYPHSKHCYPDLVEKSATGIKAQIRATLWAGTYERLNKNFESKTGRPLSDGMNILFLAKVRHDPLYGLTLNIEDIDADFELGQLLKAKMDCILQLKKANLFTLNKRLEFPLLPQRIAIISVQTSKGFQDFISILKNNSRGYRFYYQLFPALLQGDAAVDAILEQLQNIALNSHQFDLVTIIRGGGGDVGLSCYDNYDLAAAIAQFPLPVLSGIGHAANETVVEMVAHYNPITPTDLAYFLQQKFDNNAVKLMELTNQLRHLVNSSISSEQTLLSHFAQKIKNRTNYVWQGNYRKLQAQQQFFSQYSAYRLKTQRTALSQISRQLRLSSKQIIDEKISRLAFLDSIRLPKIHYFLNENYRRLNHLSDKVELLRTENLLKRGFSISLINGKSISNTNQVKIGDQIITRFYNGEISSTINKISNYEQNNDELPGSTR